MGYCVGKAQWAQMPSMEKFTFMVCWATFCITSRRSIDFGYFAGTTLQQKNPITKICVLKNAFRHSYGFISENENFPKTTPCISEQTEVMVKDAFPVLLWLLSWGENSRYKRSSRRAKKI